MAFLFGGLHLLPLALTKPGEIKMKNTTKKELTTSTVQNLQLLELKPDELIPWASNPRTHSDQQIEQLASSIREFGFTAPVLTDEDYNVLAGHARIKAAEKAGLGAVPVRVISGLTDTQKRAYVIADNRISLDAEWDLEILQSEFELILNEEYDYELTGFTMPEIDSVLEYAPSDQPVTDKKDPSDLSEEDHEIEKVTRRGDLWLLGKKHRILCGNALEEDPYKQLMNDELAEMIFTDPPYNVKTGGHIRVDDKGHKDFMMAAGEMSEKEFADFLYKSLKQIHDHSQDGSICYACMDWRHIPELLNAANKVYGRPKQMCVWSKNNGGMGTFYRSQHELIFLFKKGEATHINNFGLGENGRYRTNVWNYAGVNTFKKNREEELDMHPTVKPVEMVADAILDCSNRKGIILDPFLGSGTTIIAAEKTGRRGFGMDLDPEFVDVSIKRWKRLYPDIPIIHQETGQSYNQIATKRTKKEKKHV